MWVVFEGKNKQQNSLSLSISLSGIQEKRKKIKFLSMVLDLHNVSRYPFLGLFPPILKSLLTIMRILEEEQYWVEDSSANRKRTEEEEGKGAKLLNEREREDGDL